jgi:hypothetical protein
MATKPKDAEKETQDAAQEAQNKSASGNTTKFERPDKTGASVDPAAADLLRVMSEEPKPGDPGMVPANPDAADPSDPTKEGVTVNMTPLDTRSLGDGMAGRSDADTALLSGEPQARNRDGGPKDGGAKIEVAAGGAGVPTPDVDAMTNEQAKSFLAAYGVDAPVGQAKNLLKATILRGMAATQKRNR